MRLSKTTEYAIRALIYLANDENQIYSVNHLHKELDIPYKYLAKLMHDLSEAGLVSSLQGNQGGYRIIRDKSDIYLYQIVDVVEGLEDYTRCILGFDSCTDEDPCPMHFYWQEERGHLKEMLYKISLGDLCKNLRKRI
ncbi:MAG: Rrf2 family transcriptional regulator [Calditrichaceae bacterium]